MALGFSLFLIAIGAILTWAVTATVQGIDVTAVGVILMIVGLIGLVLTLLMYASLLPFGVRTRHAHGHDVEPEL
jgi:hypothetical protein